MTVPNGYHFSIGHPPYYNGLDYIYEDHGEVCRIILHMVTLFYFYVITIYLTQGVKLF